MATIVNLNVGDALARGEIYCRRGIAHSETSEIFLWQAENPAVVIGLGQNPETEVECENLRADKISLYRRHSGGGAVLLARHGIVTLNFEIFTPNFASASPSIRESFAKFTEPIRAAVATLSPYKIELRGISDLIATDKIGAPRKFCGVAQMRKRAAILTHGTILISGDLSRLTRYLKFPSSSPDYREQRSHSDFCVTLSECARREIVAEEVAEIIVRTANQRGWRIIDNLPTDAEVVDLRALKYENADWNWRRKNPARRD